MRRIIIFLFFIGSLCLNDLTAQEKIFFPALKAHHGFILTHRDNMGHLLKEHVKMVEIDFSILSSGDKDWEQIHHFPEKGISFLYTDLGNPVQLGKVVSVIPYLNFILNESETIKLKTRVGVGLGYFNKTFNAYDNYKNNVISSALNAAINFSLTCNVHLHKKLYFLTGVDFTHFSNGAFKYPNLGINIASINSGISYQIGNSHPLRQIKEEKQFYPSNSLTLFSSGGLKEVIPAGGLKYFAANVLLEGDRTLTLKSKITSGLNFFYDQSLQKKIDPMGQSIHSAIDYSQIGMHVGYCFYVDKLEMYFNTGAYLLSSYKGNGLIFNRIGLRYGLGRKILMNISLKTHFAKADQLEFGLGYKIK